MLVLWYRGIFNIEWFIWDSNPEWILPNEMVANAEIAWGERDRERGEGAERKKVEKRRLHSQWIFHVRLTNILFIEYKI